MIGKLENIERMFLALGDKTRLQLLNVMQHGEVSVNHLCESLNIDQPKVSRHLAYLRGSGMVETRRDGKWIFYRLARHENEQCEAIIKSIMRILFPLDKPSPGRERVIESPPAKMLEDLDGTKTPVISRNSDVIPRSDELEVYLL